jgi:hypothetical protein
MNRLTKSLVALAIMAGGSAYAQVINMFDQNSTATIDLSNPSLSRRGMNNWTVDGVNHLFQQWFWFRIGGAAEQSIDAISAPVVQTPFANLTKITYQDPLVKFETTYLLTGGGAGSSQSDIAESIRITNVSNTAYTLTFFQYTDFDMGGTAGGDTVVHANANAFQQSDGIFGASETISTPVATHWQGDFWPFLYNSLTDGLPTTLSDSGSPLTGDVSFAWQWDMVLNPGGSFLISKDKNIVPEPMSLIAVATGLAALAARRRRR